MALWVFRLDRDTSSQLASAPMRRSESSNDGASVWSTLKPGTTGVPNSHLETNRLRPSALEEKYGVRDQQAVFVLADEIGGIAGTFETPHRFRELIKGGIKLVGTPGKFRLENFAPLRYRPLDRRSEERR
jgi:hypothetical protein